MITTDIPDIMANIRNGALNPFSVFIANEFSVENIMLGAVEW